MKTAEAIVNDRPYPLHDLKRLAKEFIVQRLIEDGLRERATYLERLDAEGITEQEVAESRAAYKDASNIDGGQA